MYHFKSSFLQDKGILIGIALSCLLTVQPLWGIDPYVGLIAAVEHDTDVTPEEGFANQSITKAIKYTVSEQMNAINLGNINFAYSAFMSNAFRKATSSSVFTQFIQNYQSYWQQASFNYNKIPIHEDNVASLQGTMVKSGVGYKLQYYLIHEDGAWKILGIEVLPNF